MTLDTLALVESPAQLLHVLEWCHAEQSARRTRLVVLPPADQTTVAQLRSMAEFAAEEGIETEGSLPARPPWPEYGPLPRSGRRWPPRDGW